jgi:hypothetical protein
LNKYIAKLYLDVEVEAWTESDAREAIEDALGKGDLPGILIVDEEIVDFQELS